MASTINTCFGYFHQEFLDYGVEVETEYLIHGIGGPYNPKVWPVGQGDDGCFFPVLLDHAVVDKATGLTGSREGEFMGELLHIQNTEYDPVGELLGLEVGEGCGQLPFHTSL